MNAMMRRVISFILCFVLIAGYLPVGAFAAEVGETVSVETVPETTAGETVPETTIGETVPETTVGETVPETTIGETVPETTVGETVPETTVGETVPSTKDIAKSGGAVYTSLEDEIDTADTGSKVLVDAAIFCSDVHGNPSTVKSVFTGIKNADSTFNPTTASFVGDTQCAASSVTSQAQSVFSGVQCFYAFGNHDDEGDYGIESVTKLIYGDSSTNYYIYAISESSMGSSSPDTSDFTNTVVGLDKTKPLFIISHLPLHERRNDNNGAAAWYTAISAAAEEMDIFFFWAHNHTGDNAVDQAAYYVEKNGDETITVEGGSTVTPNFTYANAGYIDPPNTPARNNVATAVRIYEDTVNLTVYNANGVLSGTYAVNEDVSRQFASQATLTSISVSGKESYYVGDAFVAPTVTAVYYDTTKNTVLTADEYTVSGTYDMNTAGTYTLTYTYGDYSATYTFTVKADQINKIAVTTQPTKLSYITGEELDTTGMVVTATYDSGKTAEVTGWYTSDVDMTTAGTKEVTVYYAVDGIIFNATFTITVEQAAENLTLQSIAVTNPPAKTEYLVSEKLSLDGLVVTATFINDAGEISTQELAYAPFSTSTVYGGYELGDFSMYVQKGYTVTVTYTYGEVTETAEFTINVWNEKFEVSGVSVSVAAGDYGVTAVNVADSENTNVATAIADVITGDTYKAYDITLTLDAEVDAEGNAVYALTNGEKTVTLPIPEGVTNPVVYYVSEDGEIENMNATKDGKGNVTFTTTHFSTYVVGESTSITVPDPNEVPVNDSTTTYEAATIYVLTTTLTSGKKYLIVDTNEASTSAHALINNKSEPDSDTVTVNAAGSVSGYYTDSTGSTVYTASNPYIISDVSAWTVGGSYTFTNEDEYLRYNNGLSVSGTSTTWTYSNNRLSCSVRQGKNNQYVTYYLGYDNGWTASTTARNVYFYEEVTVYKATTTAINGTFSIAGNPEEIPQVVGDSTVNVTLGSTLTCVNGDTTTTSDTSTTATYEVVENGDPNGIISGINGNVVTLKANAVGTALIKVSYEVVSGKTVYNYILITAKEPTYSVDILDEDDKVAGDVIVVKGAVKDHTYDLDAKATYESATGTSDATGGTYTWEIESGSEYATIDSNGILKFTGVDGTVKVRVTYTPEKGTPVTDTVTIKAYQDEYYRPEEGVTNFPVWGYEGSVRFDKTATAVGDFSKTGTAMVELSMAGIPAGGNTDVVLMMDMTTSMSNSSSVDDAVAATKALLEALVYDSTTKTYKSNIRVQVWSFKSDNDGKDVVFENNVTRRTITSAEELTAAKNLVDSSTETDGSGFDTSGNNGNGTRYDAAMAKLYDILNGSDMYTSKYAIFASDGEPTGYEYVNSSSTTGHSTSTSQSFSSWFGTNGAVTSSYLTEYYSYQIKTAGIPLFTVGINISENSEGAYILEHMSSNYSADGKTAVERAETDPDYFATASTSTSSADLVNAFTAIAKAVKPAASNVEVDDKIADAYEIVFTINDTHQYDVPNMSAALKASLQDSLAAKDASGDVIKVDDYELKDFYIEVASYTLGDDNERTGEYSFLQRIYFDGTTINAVGSGSVSAAGVTTFNATDIAPTFKAAATNEEGELEDAYFNWTDSDKDGVYDAAEPYSYAPNGDGNAHMQSGAYVGTYNAYDANGKPIYENITDDEVTATKIKGAEYKALHTIYFTYDLSAKTFYWTVTSLQKSKELELKYFTYLTGSLEGLATGENEVPAGTYETNEYATLTYINHLGNPCQQYFPVPRLTWNGAQVSYVFYLVNAAGEPVNQEGEVVSFNEAVFVTDLYTQSVVWNGTNGTATLDVDLIAKDLLPADYELYDDNAVYQIYVHKNAGQVDEETDTTIYNYFIIEGSQADYLKERHGVTTANVSTTKVYNTKAGTKYIIDKVKKDDGTEEYPTITKDDATLLYAAYATEDTDINNYTEVTQLSATNFDYGSTTVAFAVTWEVMLVEDVVVVDFGLPVDINVAQNDFISNAITGIGTVQPGYVINTGTGADPSFTEMEIDTDHYTAEASESIIRFTQKDMVFNQPVKFYYETQAEYYVGGEKTTPYLYSSVTVIPATTIYYEDSFVTLEVWDDATNTQVWSTDPTFTNVPGARTWTTEGTVVNATQSQDRPGESQISADLDADNVYGYDSAYKDTSTYSMGTARKLNVDSDYFGMAKFSFWGTGFDVISLTSNTTGNIVVQVKQNNVVVGNYFVDTYYSYYQQITYVTHTYTDGAWVEGESTTTAPSDTTKIVTALPESGTADETVVLEKKEWVISKSSENAIYQVPVITVTGLNYGKYDVEITTAYYDGFDHNGTDSGYDFYLDAIRIYDPTGVVSGTKTDSVVSDAYNKDGENYPVYEELRNNIIAANTFVAYGDSFIIYTMAEITAFEDGVTYYTLEDGTYTAVPSGSEYDEKVKYYIQGSTANGIVFIDGNGENISIADYTSYGPNNELYLANNQAITFNVNVPENVADIQLGIKMANGTPVTYEISAVNAAGTLIKKESITVSTATDMYYSILEYAKAGTVTIKNTSGGILSLTNIKVTHTSAPATESGISLLSMDAESTGTVLMMMRRAPVVEDETPEDTTPETTVPETTVPEETVPETTVPETTEPEVTEPEVTEPEETEPEAPDFEPEKLSVYLSRDSVKKGTAVIVTVRTSADVEMLTVNGVAVTSYSYSRWSGTKTWIVTVKADQVGEMSIDVVGYNADGQASTTVSNTITVTERSGSFFDDLRDWFRR